MERIDTVVVGAGQAGLATSWFLTQHGREHVVLERGRVANTWRTERWDGFFLNTPNFAQRLPGGEYRGDDPDGFAPLADVIEYVDGYARSFGAPVREGVAVTALRTGNGGYEVQTAAGEIVANNVVVATGAFQRARPPLPETEAAPVEIQLTTSEYRRPEQLPPGAVLVVGGAQSGCQIAEELLDDGRLVYLAIGRCPWFPRRYRGRDIVEWLERIGMFDDSVDTLPSPALRLAGTASVSGNDGGHDCHPRRIAGRGAVVVGRLESIEEGVVRFAGGVEQALAASDDFVADLTARIDSHIDAARLDAPPAEERDRGPSPIEDTPALDLREHGVAAIVWATGYRPDYGWIALDVTDGYGLPVQRRGVSEYPGLYFVGVNWLHTRKSALFLGVGEDAEHVVSHLVARR